MRDGRFADAPRMAMPRCSSEHVVAVVEEAQPEVAPEAQQPADHARGVAVVDVEVPFLGRPEADRAGAFLASEQPVVVLKAHPVRPEQLRSGIDGATFGAPLPSHLSALVRVPLHPPTYVLALPLCVSGVFGPQDSVVAGPAYASGLNLSMRVVRAASFGFDDQFAGRHGQANYRLSEARSTGISAVGRGRVAGRSRPTGAP